MVATNGITSELNLDGKRRHRGTAVSSASSVFQESADTHLFIDWCSLLTDCSNGTTQTETANAQNQITSISGSSAPTYDNSGNMISDQNGNTYVYDAWNRLVAVKNSSGTVIAQYTYNAMGYRVTESYPQGGTRTAAGTVNYIYYDCQWQAIETRTNGTAISNVSSQMVWSAAYINAAVLRDMYADGSIELLTRVYFLQDANWNTTAIINYLSAVWQVIQQYVYSPYGTITVNGGGSVPELNNLYQGMTLDPVTGLYYARNRNYSPTLGRWINQDPAGYINGANTYQFVMSNPVGKTDPEGLCNCDKLDKQWLQNESQRRKLGNLIYISQVLSGMEKEGLDKKVQQWRIDEQQQALADMESNLQNLRKAEKQIYQQIEQSGCPLPESGYSYSPPPYAFPGTGGGPGPGHDSTELILQILEIIVGAF